MRQLPVRPSFLLLLLAAAVTLGVTGFAITEGLAAQHRLDARVTEARAGRDTLPAAYAEWHAADRRAVWLGVCAIGAGAMLGFAAARLHRRELAQVDEDVAFDLAATAALASLPAAPPARPEAMSAPEAVPTAT